MDRHRGSVPDIGTVDAVMADAAAFIERRDAAAGPQEVEDFDPNKFGGGDDRVQWKHRGVSFEVALDLPHPSVTARNFETARDERVRAADPQPSRLTRAGLARMTRRFEGRFGPVPRD